MVDLIDALAARRVESRVVLPEGGYVASALQARMVPYVVSRYWPWAQETPLPRWDRFLKKPLVHVLRAVKLSRLIGRWRCHVIVTNTLTVCEGALAARILRLPHITYAREFGDLDHDLHFEWNPPLSMRLLNLLSARVVFNSAALANHYRRQVLPAQTRVIYNAVSIPAASLAQSDPSEYGATFSCVLVGSLTPGKGHEDAIRAIANLSRRGTRVNLKLIGGGSSAYLERLRRLIDVLGVSGLVEMVGHVPDPQLFFHQADVALMCSRMEAFGRVTVEAMKLGTPVIGARSGGTSEIIHDRFNGFLYTPGDVRELADKIEELTRDRDGARQMGERARSFATEMFSLERYGSEFLDLLNEVTEARAGGASGLRVRVPALPAMEKAFRVIRTSLGSWVTRRRPRSLS
jgi:glycosyltransferase involved in cell wall biosynthesis